MNSFTDWVDFTFGLSSGPSMLAFDQYPGSAHELLGHCLRFFRTARLVLAQVPRQRAEQVLDRIPGVDGYLGILANTTIEFHLRAELAAAHLPLFEQVFLRDSYGIAASIWWEHLSSALASWESTHPRPGRINDSAIQQAKLIHDCLVEALEQILYLPSEICQESALRGLYELGCFGSTDRTVEIINRFLAANIHKTPKVEAYARDIAEDDEYDTSTAPDGENRDS